jgi:hypothetical protein
MAKSWECDGVPKDGKSYPIKILQESTIPMKILGQTV